MQSVDNVMSERFGRYCQVLIVQGSTHVHMALSLDCSTVVLRAVRSITSTKRAYRPNSSSANVPSSLL